MGIAMLPADPTDGDVWSEVDTDTCCDRTCSGHVCGAGYTSNPAASTIARPATGRDAACCIPKTCASVGCNANRELSGTPTWVFNAATPTNPTESGCCKDKTGYCTGNMASANNVVCGTGYNQKLAPLSGAMLTESSLVHQHGRLTRTIQQILQSQVVARTKLAIARATWQAPTMWFAVLATTKRQILRRWQEQL